MTSPARVAANVAALLPLNDPLGQMARRRLALAAREQEHRMIDPRDVQDIQIGSRLRDAAVDPKPGDYRAPVNAGKPGEAGNPHGSNVYSLEVV
ncbi:hypothetical protein DQ244_06090 [Blastococcus sp. TBT05-19]|uniref:hypothetical protein n=1 Tax=Blastococcus sp. TBT05-19 TaxID=2250581 RepID=UPI000DE83041|nr:hypothetical protein [Blastococcus sp. TBT05-19]RBY94828.1 hypothetical protein DQ244_06090 [Blastococcus sp. TBT05-19]